MKQPRFTERHDLPRRDVLEDDERSLWSLDDLYELTMRGSAPLDHEIIVPSDASDFSTPPPPHGASWDPF